MSNIKGHSGSNKVHGKSSSKRMRLKRVNIYTFTATLRRVGELEPAKIEVVAIANTEDEAREIIFSNSENIEYLKLVRKYDKIYSK